MDLPDLMVLLDTEAGVQKLEATGRVSAQGPGKCVIVYNENRPFHRWLSDNRELSCLDTVSEPFFTLLLANDQYR